ncbi:unnamed protein product [Rotaria magnacalcarata]|uniref:Metallo-beta-lactamase domain-containing protein n=1 Tax=Rotaria magnacalcarata TaxID=392030 RepID=A0A819TRE6_9BILA|nr:unnamed protein product [Rotaria magnacalcarata]CAF1424293.1 unnamed protein product [Rotaria magnacalcarata]CAF2087832.1 unnamed protein product [Rotaria magnacalcarata]CAF3880053.1 unnamed protein product [Rotaria magnacalcarata]CAF4060843.1 unnamed protein product [Rotaria magnacalcarata]
MPSFVSCQSLNPIQNSDKNELHQIGSGFWNVRGRFKILAKLVDIETHMSFIQLHNGKFLVIDTIELNDKLRQEINHLTDNGDKIEAVIGTHPFHTLSFPAFYESYPNAVYYGTPRHLRRLTHIPWIGNLHDCDVRKKWEPDVELRIPADKPNFLLKLFGYKDGTMAFHPSIKNVGLHPTSDAPYLFRDWMRNMLNDWPFENICCAHMGVKKGGAHRDVFTLLVKAEFLFAKLSKRNRKQNPEGELATSNHHTMNILEDECG